MYVLHITVCAICAGCGGVYNEKPKGTITSPNYPNSYPHEVECEWLITAPWDKSIEITIKDLQMEDIGECDFDYLAVSCFHFTVSLVGVGKNSTPLIIRQSL